MRKISHYYFLEDYSPEFLLHSFCSYHLLLIALSLFDYFQFIYLNAQQFF